MPRLNWTWICHRAAMLFRCRHAWMLGDSAGHQACEKCGAWRWFPMLTLEAP